VKLIGVGLYQHLLNRALAEARGEAVEEEWTPLLHLGLDTNVPEDYIPEPELRLSLHVRLAQLSEAEDPESLAEEISDRFGPLPEPVQNLLALADLRRAAHRLRIERLDVGPQALAASFRASADLPTLAARIHVAEIGMEWRGERLIWAKPTETAEERREAAREFLDRLAG
jgi:transcription-repair coupling factor (superfamily II helicase)